MSFPLRSLRTGAKAGGPATAAVAGGTTLSRACPPEPCPSPQADDHVCGCLNPPAPMSHQSLVSVISGDTAVRRSLVLLLEAEGLTTRAFCTVPSFLGVIGRVPGPRRQCVLMDEEQARRIDAEGLARHVAQEGGPVSIVVLASAAPHRKSPTARPLEGVAFVDPFRMDEVLTAIRGALGAS